MTANAGVQTPNSSASSLDNVGYKTNSARRKAIFRAKKSLPKSPTKYAVMMHSFISSASPRKRKAMDEIGIHCPKKMRLEEETYTAIKSKLHELKGMKTKEARKQRQSLLKATFAHYKNKRFACQQLGVRWKYLQKISSLKENDVKRSDSLSSDTSESIKDFYLRPEISIVLPNTKYVRKGMPRRYLQRTVNSTYKMFKTQYPEKKVGKSKFASMRPKHVKTQKAQPMNECLCEYCSNIEMKLKTVKQICSTLERQDLKVLCEDRYNFVQATLCQKPEGQKYSEKACIERECKKCGLEQLKDKLKPITQQKTEVSWNQWCLVETEFEAKQKKKPMSNHDHSVEKEIKKKKHMGLVKITSSVDRLVDDLCSEAQQMSTHLFNASWQLHQFQHVSTVVPDKSLITVLDFGQNYDCFYQDSAQSTYWHHKQVTVHPIVCYYRCPIDNEIVKEDVICLSPDKQHDAKAVKEFLRATYNHLQNKRKISINQEYQFCDGCSCQYKSKNPFEDISKSPHPVIRCFFGSRHGKGPSDAATGVVKSFVRDAVKARRAVVSNADEMYDFCRKYMTKDDEPGKCTHKRRTFILVAEIPRAKDYNAKTVPGTRKIHSVASTESPFVIKTRNLACMCSGCLEGFECCNKKYVEPWKTHSILESSKEMEGQQMQESDSEQEEFEQRVMLQKKQKKRKPKQKRKRSAKFNMLKQGHPASKRKPKLTKTKTETDTRSTSEATSIIAVVDLDTNTTNIQQEHTSHQQDLQDLGDFKLQEPTLNQIEYQNFIQLDSEKIDNFLKIHNTDSEHTIGSETTDPGHPSGDEERYI